MQPALAAQRAVRVLDFLSSRPTQVFTLAEISRAIGVNAPSMLSVLTALNESGYVVRDPRHKTYMLGPAIVGLGQAALLQHPVLEAAKIELKILAKELSAQCVGNVVLGEELVAIVDEGRPRRLRSQSWLGARVPYAAPFGPCFAAHASDEKRSDWIADAARTPEARSRLQRELDAVRQHGFAVGIHSAQQNQLADELAHTLDAPEDHDARERLRRLAEEIAVRFGVVDIERDEVIDINYISVPVVTPRGDVVMAITASGFARAMTGAVVHETAALMLASAATISRRAFGGSGVSSSSSLLDAVR